MDLSETGKQLLFGTFADAAGVDDDDVGISVVRGRLIPRLLQQSGHSLGIMEVHLAAERLDQVFLGHEPSLSLLPYVRFRLRRLEGLPARFSSISRALATTTSEMSAPPIMRAS